jgi:hypothetical protein
MHMLMTIAGGIVLLGVFLLFGRLWGGSNPDLALAAKAFIPLWFAVAIVNLAIGVSRAGYSVREEVPILLGVFAVPVVIAIVTICQIPRP